MLARSKLASCLALLVAIPACKVRDIEVIQGRDAPVTITLVNPTTCSDCDPFEGVDSLRLDVVRPETGEVIYSDTFASPGSAAVLPDLQGFGVVRVELYGLEGNQVRSAGRTAPFAVPPSGELALSMLFLPANRAIPLTATLDAERSGHVGFSRLDGLVALIGGVDPAGSSRFGSVEIFDPATFEFTAESSASDFALYPAVTTESDGDLLLIGGESAGGSRQQAALAYTVSGEGATGAVEPQGDLPEPRSQGCVALGEENKGVVMGGASGDAAFDTMKRGDSGWEFSRAQVDGLDDASVVGCIALGDGRVFVLGDEGSQTGFFQYNGDETLGFSPVASGHGEQFVPGATLALLENGHVWVVGGADDGGDALSRTWEFRADEASFAPSVDLRTPRVRPSVVPWLLPETEAVGCGWTNDGLGEGAGTVEIVRFDGTTGLVVALDRERPGCAMNMLPDGSLLVSGGFGVNDAGQLGAVLVVPVIDSGG